MSSRLAGQKRGNSNNLEEESKRPRIPRGFFRVNLCLESIQDDDEPFTGFELLAQTDENYWYKKTYYTFDSQRILGNSNHQGGRLGVQLRNNESYQALMDVIERYRPPFSSNIRYDELEQFNNGWKRVSPGEIEPLNKVYAFIPDYSNASIFRVGLVVSGDTETKIYNTCLEGFSGFHTNAHTNQHNLRRTAVYEAPQEIQEAYMNFFEFKPRNVAWEVADIIGYQLGERHKTLPLRQSLQVQGYKVDMTDPSLGLGELLDIKEVNDYIPKIGGKRRKTRRHKKRSRKTKRQRSTRK